MDFEKILQKLASSPSSGSYSNPMLAEISIINVEITDTTDKTQQMQTLCNPHTTARHICQELGVSSPWECGGIM